MAGSLQTAMAAAVVAGLMVCGCARADTERAIGLEPVVEFGLAVPVLLTHAGDDSGRLFVLEQTGRIRVIGAEGELEPDAWLDIRSKVRAGGEQGLLGLAFHPDFPDEPRFFVNYTRTGDGATVVAAYRVGADGAPLPESERELLVIEQPYGNHNGGMIEFGPDGLLYIGMGDGGAGGDPHDYGQDPDVLLGKMLRIDVDAGEPYGIPADNPFAAGGGRPEIFATGLRNPWRFSFDRETGELWAGDVGQNAIEEIDVVERGGNYGWRLMEGTRPYNPENGADDLVPPVAEYANAGARCSVTGGYVYRGEAVPALAGAYVFGDYCSGEIMALEDGEIRVLLEPGFEIPSFGEDAAGELYVLDHEGAVYRIRPRDAAS